MAKKLIASFVGTNREFRESLGLEKKLEVKCECEPKVSVCLRCDGTGALNVADSEDDFQMIECFYCSGEGYSITD